MANRFYAKTLKKTPPDLPADYVLKRAVATDTSAIEADITSLESRATALEARDEWVDWDVKTASFTFGGSGEKYVIEATSAAATADLPATIAAGDYFILHNSSASTQVVDVDPMSGHTIRGAADSAVGGTDTVSIAVGETIYIVAYTSALLEIV
jgi:hypothetical protein